MTEYSKIECYSLVDCPKQSLSGPGMKEKRLEGGGGEASLWDGRGA